MDRDPAPVVETTRWLAGDGDRVESRHLGHLVVVGPDGGIVTSIGDPQRLTFVRSTVKPFQATVSLELSGRELPDELVAVGWSSHRGEPEHLSAVTDLLGRAGLGPADLTTPASDEDDPAASRLSHNCSGKHALFALAGATVGCPRGRLLDPDGEVQRAVLEVLSEVLADARSIPVGIDGCGAPAVAAPLVGLARAYLSLARGEDRWARVVSAGLAHPHLVGGTGRLESALLAAGLIAKPGAEGTFAVGWRDERGPFALAVKVEDGASRGASVAVAGFLRAAGVIGPEVLGPWDAPVVLGGGRPAGEVRASGVLLAAAEDLHAR